MTAAATSSKEKPFSNAPLEPLDAEQHAQESLDRLFGTGDKNQDLGFFRGSEVTGDLHSTAGDLTFGEDGNMDDVELDGLEEELQHFQGQQVVASILGQGSELREFAKDVEEKLRQVELDSIQDYIRESDNLVSLHTQIRECDGILSSMEALLGGFQSDLGAISSEIKSLQEQSMSMGIKLKNRKEAEAKLANYIEDIVVPPELVENIVDGEVNDSYIKYLQMLTRKLQFVAEDPIAQTAASFKDVAPEFERLRAKAIAKSRDFLMRGIFALKKPKTNIQILQQNVLLKYRYLATFLSEHGKEVWPEVRGAYVETMSKVLSAHLRAYIHALEKLQLDIVTKYDLIGIDDSKGTGGGLFSRNRSDALKNRSAVFSLGDRANVLKEIDEPAIIPHISEASGAKYPYEVLFRSLHKLLMDTATSEYLFCRDFFGEDATFQEIFAGPLTVVDEHFLGVLPNCYDAIGLMLMIRMTYQHQLVMSRRRVPCLDSFFDKVNLAVWPRFKAVFDMHLSSVRGANVRALWEDDVHPHYVTRRYAEFSASLLQLNTDYGDGQLDMNLDRLRASTDDLLVKLSRLFSKPKQQTIFLINNYDMVLAVLKETGIEGGKIQQQFEELLASSTTVFVEEELREHFGPLIKFVKTRAGVGDDSAAAAAAAAAASSAVSVGPSLSAAASSSAGSSFAPASAAVPAMSEITLAEVQPLVKDFAVRWKSAIELMHKDVITYFSNFVCGMEILRAALTQLLLYYTRLSDCLKRVGGGGALGKDVVSISSIMYEIKKYSRTF